MNLCEWLLDDIPCENNNRAEAIRTRRIASAFVYVKVRSGGLSHLVADGNEGRQ